MAQPSIDELPSRLARSRFAVKVEILSELAFPERIVVCERVKEVIRCAESNDALIRHLREHVVQ